MKKYTITAMLIVLMLSSAETCEKENVRTGAGCFAGSPLEKIPWAKDQLQAFQRPRSGPLRVTVYSYKRENFLAYQNAFVSSPMSYIFDCSGTNITKRGINYNAFMDEATAVKVLLQATY